MEYVKWLWEVFLFFVPRFITEDVAIHVLPDGDWVIVCAMIDIDQGEEYDGVISLTSLVFMFWGFMATVEEDQLRPWPKHEWIDAKDGVK